MNVRGDRFAFQTGYEAGHVVSVGPDITKRAGWSRPIGVSAPLRLFVATLLKRQRQPLLRIFHLNKTHFAECARQRHLARLPGPLGIRYKYESNQQ